MDMHIELSGTTLHGQKKQWM